MDRITDRNVIVACVAKVGMVGSALKGNGPVNRAIVKLTTIDDNVEIVNYRVAESAPLKKEFPPSSGKYDGGKSYHRGTKDDLNPIVRDSSLRCHTACQW